MYNYFWREVAPHMIREAGASTKELDQQPTRRKLPIKKVTQNVDAKRPNKNNIRQKQKIKIKKEKIRHKEGHQKTVSKGRMSACCPAPYWLKLASQAASQAEQAATERASAEIATARAKAENFRQKYCALKRKFDQTEAETTREDNGQVLIKLEAAQKYFPRQTLKIKREIAHMESENKVLVTRNLEQQHNELKNLFDCQTAELESTTAELTKERSLAKQLQQQQDTLQELLDRKTAEKENITTELAQERLCAQQHCSSIAALEQKLKERTVDLDKCRNEVSDNKAEALHFQQQCSTLQSLVDKKMIEQTESSDIKILQQQHCQKIAEQVSEHATRSLRLQAAHATHLLETRQECQRQISEMEERLEVTEKADHRAMLLLQAVVSTRKDLIPELHESNKMRFYAEQLLHTHNLTRRKMR